MKKFFLYTIGVLILYQIYFFGDFFINNRYVPADYIILSDQVIEDVKDKLSKRYNMKVIGIKGGLADCVNLLGLEFQILGPLPKEQLRQILVNSVEEFLSSINANEALRPFLKNYPFNPTGIDISIFVMNSNGEGIFHPNIKIASAYEGKIIYRTEEQNHPFTYKSRIEEDYDTAFKIVQEESLRKK